MKSDDAVLCMAGNDYIALHSLYNAHMYNLYFLSLLCPPSL